MRFFNTEGPVDFKKHYCLDPLERLNISEVMSLIEQEKYFVLHSPRQSGKTTCLLALTENLNQSGKFRCLYCNVEPAQVTRENVEAGIQTILNEMSVNAGYYLKDDFLKTNWKKIFIDAGPYSALTTVLSAWANNISVPLVVLFDEIDALVGDTLISVLRQIRTGYARRPKLFPQSIILCGVRDIRGYRIHSQKDKMIITGGSAFNIKSESLQLGNFSKQEIVRLLMQHTKETGQKFEESVYNLVYELTDGQPWLVNALAYEVCSRMKKNRVRKNTLTADMFIQAKENIILRRA